MTTYKICIHYFFFLFCETFRNLLYIKEYQRPFDNLSIACRNPYREADYFGRRRAAPEARERKFDSQDWFRMPLDIRPSTTKRTQARVKSDTKDTYFWFKVSRFNGANNIPCKNHKTEIFIYIWFQTKNLVFEIKLIFLNPFYTYNQILYFFQSFLYKKNFFNLY